MKKTIALLLLCFTAFQGAFSQGKLSIEDVKQVNYRNSGEIMNGEEIKGYFVFYVSDKIDRKTNEYTIQIMDNNLNKVKDVKFEDDKDVQVLESSYNGNSILFMFYNRKEKTIEYRSYGFDGKVISTYTKELDNRSKYYFESTYGGKNEEGQNESIFSVGNTGYVTIFPLKEGKYYTYEINFFFTDRKKAWTFEAAEEQEDKYASALYLGATDSVVMFEVMKKKKLMGGSPHSWLLGINIFTGKKAFEISTESEEDKFYPMNLANIRGSSDFLLLGTYYEPDGKIMKDASLGLAAWQLSRSGKIIQKKYNAWDGPISKLLNTDSRGRIADVGYIYFHRLLQSEDGDFFAVGEGYKKVASGLGMASAFLSGMSGGGGGGVSMMKIKITDLMVMRFNSKFEVKSATVYPKFSNSLELPSGYEFLTPHTMALIAKSFGAFDYDFLLTDNDHSRFTIGYSDYERSGDYKGRTFNSITYAEGKTSTDKIKLSSQARWMRIFPAKPGFIMLQEYFKKEKRMEMRLEKIN